MLERILVGESTPLDLVNTEWIERGEWVDHLADDESAARWLIEYGFDPATDDLDALRTVRRAIRAVLDDPGPDAEAGLNAALARGHESIRVVAGEPVVSPLAEPGWGAAWRIARAFVDLMAQHPDRVRQCAHPDCVLYFHDTSRNGGRRWHSMETCGARTKSARHYRRHLADAVERGTDDAPE
ncbi:CGNR zinc finger domain-containing protein [Microbacterium sp. CJ88]|uniref:CGNR zinc finger domain-containing protein n=1 Tax=Microbacterium sp. CJ88 TaxID=3445672 RepID=UPI003F65CFBD